MASSKTFEIEFDALKEYVYVRFHGVIGIDSVMEAVDQLINAPEYEPGMPGIYDISDADISGVDGDMTLELAQGLITLTEGRIGKPKVAILSGNELNVSMGLLLKEYYEDGVTDLSVFQTLAEAELWFNLEK